MEIAVVTNDIYTKEDAQFLVRSQALATERIAGVEKQQALAVYKKYTSFKVMPSPAHEYGCTCRRRGPAE